MPAPGRQIIGLDVIRFAAACMVMVFHLGNTDALSAWTWWGWVGVPIFFILSGFVISYSAESATPGGFLQSRLFRLAPATWICGSLTAAGWLAVGGGDNVAHRYLNTMTLWPWGPWIDPVYWTLPIEAVFYLLVFALLAARAFSRSITVFGLLSAASLGYWVAHLSAQRWPALAWITMLPGRDAQLLLLEHGCCFGLGGALWLCYRRGLSLSRGAVVAAALAGSALQCAFFGRGFSSTSTLVVPEAILLLAVLSMAAAIWFRSGVDGLLGRFARPIRIVGLATYPLYLLHDDAGMMVRDALSPTGIPMWAASAVAMGVAVAGSIAVTMLAEPPVRAALRALLDFAARRHGAQPATQPDPL